MKNVLVVDAAANATLSVFQATDEEFAQIFPGHGQDIELIEDLAERMDEAAAGELLAPLWGRPILKRDAGGIHGVLYYGHSDLRRHLPATKREVDWPESAINPAQRALFAANR